MSRARERLELIAADVEQADEATSAASERARINVTRAIKAAVRRIAEQEPELGHLLRGTVRTGTACRYEPDPGTPLDVGGRALAVQVHPPVSEAIPVDRLAAGMGETCPIIW